MYLPPEQFNLRYPLWRMIGEGEYGKVYWSVTSAVKIISGTEDHIPIDGTVELDIYSRVRSQAIAEVENWTFENNQYKIAFPYGLSVFNTGLSVEEIAGDLLSAVYLLEQIDICHNDIKPSNMIFLYGHIQLIDFGIATPLIHQNGQLIVSHPLFTGPYRSPRIGTGPVDNRVSLYAIGRSIQSITNSGQDIVNDLLSEEYTCEQMFLKYPNLRRTRGTIVETPIIPPKSDCSEIIIRTLSNWITGLLDRSHNSPKTIFLTIHLIHRTLDLAIPNYQQEKGKVQLLGVACMYLAIQVNEGVQFTIPQLVYLCNDMYTTDQIRDAIVRVLIIVRTVVSTRTSWDSAISINDLVERYPNLISCEYDPNRVYCYRPGIDKLDFHGSFVELLS